MRPKTVFLIDDDPEDLQFMTDALKRVDSTLVHVSFLYPEEAVKRLTNELIALPDYIFIDLNMPKIPGEECLRQLRKTNKLSKIPIILYSTSMPKEVSERLVNAGASFTFAKPNTEDEYTGILESIIFGNVLPVQYLQKAVKK